MPDRPESQLGDLTDGDDRCQAAFFEAAEHAFLSAQDTAGGSDERTFTIAGYHVRLRFAGRPLIPSMTTALAHLVSEPSESPDLTVCIWDSASTRTPMMPPPWPTADHSIPGLNQLFRTERFQMLFQPANCTLSMLDRSRDLALWWIPDASQLTYYETISPLRALLHWWMSRHGRQLVHAGAVGTADGGVLLPAKGGSGKSTTALACLEAGLSYLGDNSILLGTDGLPVHAYSLYSSAALHSTHLEETLPHLLPLIWNPQQLGQQKAFAFLHERYPTQMTASLPIRAVLVPRFTGRRDTELAQSSPAASLKALVPSTVFSLPGAGRETFETLVRVVAPLPHYVLNLGTDLSQVPRAVSNLLRTLLSL